MTLLPLPDGDRAVASSRSVPTMAVERSEQIRLLETVIGRDPEMRPFGPTVAGCARGSYADHPSAGVSPRRDASARPGRERDCVLVAAIESNPRAGHRMRVR